MNIIDEKYYTLTITDKVNIRMKKEVLELSSYKEIHDEFIKIINTKLSPLIDSYLDKTDTTYMNILKREVYTGIIKRLNDYLTNRFNGLYLIYSPKMDLLKIGITKNIDTRLESIKRDVDDNNLEVIEYIIDKANQERILHEKYKKDNVRIIGTTGVEHREWFNNKTYIKKHFEKLK